ncbi:hypothetical protein [Legionella clemsonensis]|uniref:Uncharacterized protein n=1 Tax=Legionella clemsonensis TaxID=1867846 RepID=A0A222NYD5_9GAMM|nr:hypothetical protein [Legionella clemsonensis]ASQ44607.1 hypothetical protein clem_00200 [Legionella clemsonensis]
MKVLIPTEPDDCHAILVKIALEKLGHQVRLLFTADQPTKQRNSVFITAENYQWKNADNYHLIMDNDYDVVWWRRARKPYLPKKLIHPQDYKFAARENALFFESITCNMAPTAWWINTKEASTRANSKLLQLKLAAACGMNIPITLCSNSPQDIRQFLLKYDAEGVIYKPLCSNFWFEDEQVRISYTTKVKFLNLPSNKLLQLVPGIFQKEVKKKYELRITCFGDYLVAAKLNSQVHPDGQVDWRAIPEGALAVEPYKLSAEFEEKIRLFMRKLGIVFGAFDFIVTPEDEYIFLEVNEQGQFLWIEEANPEFRMLDIFINFLLNKSPEFIWDFKNSQHTIERYRSQMAGLIAQNRNRHVDLNCAEAYNE